MRNLITIGIGVVVIVGFVLIMEKAHPNTDSKARYYVEEHALTDGTTCAVSENSITCNWSGPRNMGWEFEQFRTKESLGGKK